MSNLTVDDVDLRLTETRAELQEEDTRLWNGLEDEKVSRIAGDEANKNLIADANTANANTESRLSNEVIQREQGDLRNIGTLTELASALSDYKIKTDLELNNERIAREQLGVDLKAQVDHAQAAFDHGFTSLGFDIQAVRDKHLLDYQAMDKRIKKYEEMLSDITTDSVQITMDNGEINMGAWTILSQARQWDLEILQQLKDKSAAIDKELQDAIDDITNKLPTDQDIIDKAIEAISQAPIIKEMDEKLGSSIEDISDLYLKQAAESVKRAEEIIATNQKFADDLDALSKDLEAKVAAEASSRVEAVAREAQIRTQQIAEISQDIIDEAVARQQAIEAKAQELLTKIDAETAGRIEAIELLQDGLTQEIQHRKDGDTATLTALDNYKVSNDRALANVQDQVRVVVTEQGAQAERMTALDARIGTVDAKAGAAQSAAATAQQTANTAVEANKATAEQVNAVSASLRTAVNLLIAAYSNPNEKKRKAEGWTYVPNGVTVSDANKSATTNGNNFTITYPTTTNNGWITARNPARTDWDSFPVPLDEGKKYLISLYVKTSVANRMSFLFQMRNPNGTTTNLQVLRVANNASTFDTTTTLTRVTFYTPQAVPAGFMQGRLVFQFNGLGVAGTVATVERMMIEEMLLNPKEASPWVPGPEDPTLTGEFMDATAQAASALKTRVDNNADGIRVLGEAMTVVQSDLRDTKATVAGHTTAISTMTTDIKSNKDGITQIADAQTVIKNDLKVAKDNIDINTGAISGLSSEVSTIKGEVKTVVQDVTNLSATVNQHTEQLKTTATVGALDALKLEVKQVADNNTINGNKITQLDASFNANLTGLSISANQDLNLNMTYWRATGEITKVQDNTGMGNQIIKIGNNNGNDNVWMHTAAFMPFEPNRFYKLRAKLRRVTGGGTVYVGVSCKNIDKLKYVTTTNTLTDDMGSSVYLLSAGAPALGVWQEYEWYIKGRAAGAAIIGSANMLSPCQLPNQAAWFAPMLIANYTAAAGEVEVAYVTLESAEAYATIDANVKAINSTNIKVEQQGKDITAVADTVTKLDARIGVVEGGLNTKADASALERTDAEVSRIDGVTKAQGQSITDLNAALTVTTDLGKWTSELTRLQSQGKPLRDDPTFKTGNGGLSAYSFTAGTTMARQAKSTDNPTGSTHEMLVRYTQSLGGGWYPTVPPLTLTANKTFLIKQIAKLPVGTKFLMVGNSTGTGGYIRILGNDLGTGKFETYYAIVQGGPDLASSIHGHFRVINGTNPPTPSTDKPVDVILGSYEAWDCTAINDSIPKEWADKVTATANAQTVLEGKVTDQGGVITTQGTAISKLQNDLSVTNTELNKEVTARTNAITGVMTEVKKVDDKVTINSSSITEIGGRLTTVEGNAQTALTNAANAQTTANTAVTAAGSNATAINSVNAKYNALPNQGVNLLDAAITNPQSKPVFTTGHPYIVDKSYETPDMGRYVITPTAAPNSGVYFNTGGQAPLRLTLPEGKYLFSFYAKFTGTPTTFPTDWVMYGVATAPTRFNITKNLVRYSMVFDVPVGGRTFCPLSMTNPTGMAAGQNVVVYFERLMVERVTSESAIPSVWVEGSSRSMSEIAQSEARVNSTITAVSDAQKATAAKLDTLEATYNNTLSPGKNILKKSNVELVRGNGAYLIGGYPIGYALTPGKTYTLVYCSTHVRASGDTSSVIDAWVDSTQNISIQNYGGDRVIKAKTFTCANGANAKTSINFYCFPSGTAAGTQSTVHWAVLMEGTTQGTADWFQSPYDVEQLVLTAEGKITALQKVVTDNQTANTTRMDNMNTAIDTNNRNLSGQITTLSDSFTDYKSTTNSELTLIKGRVTDTEKGLEAANVATRDLTTRVDTTEKGIASNSTALTLVNATISALNTSDALDYEMKNPDAWMSHYAYDMKQYFKTTTSGKVSSTVFRKDTSNPVNCYNYNLTNLPNDRAYKVSCWMRRSPDSTGSYAFPIMLGRKGVWSTNNYTAVQITAAELPADGAWHLVSKIINMTSSSDTNDQIRIGIALGHTGSAGWSEAQAFKINGILTTADMDGSVADATALQKVAADVVKVDDRVTTVAQSVTQLKAEIIVPNNNLLRNGNFIAMTGTRPTYWAEWGTTNAVRTVETINGKQWLHIVANNTAIFRGISQSTSANAFKRKTEYTVSFNAFSANATGGITLLIHQSGGGNNDPQIAATIPITNVNKRYSYTFTSVDSDVKTAFNFMIGPQNGVVGDVYITDIMFSEGNVAAGWNASADETNAALAGNAQAITDTKAFAEAVDGRVTTVSNTVTTLSTQVGDNKAALEVQGRTIDGVKAEYFVKTDVNGLVAGYGLINSGTTSAFAVNADYFYIGKPTNNKKPFIVLTSPQTIGGITYPAGTWIDVAMIASATIGTAHIADAAITNAKIANLDASKITTGVLNAARIKVGPTSSFEAGYDPAANLQAAKDYQDITQLNGTGKIFNRLTNLRTGVSNLSTMVIHTPITLNAYMNLIQISGYNYTAGIGNNFSIELGFYAYTSANPFPNPRVRVSGIELNNVTLATDSAGKVCILITPKSSWSYPYLSVDSAAIMHTNPPDTFKNNWSITQETDVSGYTNKLVVPNIDSLETEAGAQAKAQAVQVQVNEFSADGILSSPEKKQLRTIWDEIAKEKPVMTLNASALGVSSTSYVTAHDTLNTYLSPLLANLNVNSSITRGTMQAYFATYYDEKAKLNKAMNDAIKAVGDQAKSTADSKSRTYITQPTIPYYAGDVWKSGTSTFICITTRVSGSFTAADWVKTGDVTSENTAANANSLGGTAASTINQNISNAASAAQAAQDTANNISVGARNYLIGGKSTATTKNSISPDFKLKERGDQYVTISFDIDITSPVSAGSRNRIGFEFAYVTAAGQTIYVGAWLNNAAAAGVYKGRVTNTMKLPTSPSTTDVAVLPYYNQTSGGAFTISNVKLELGNKPTDWTPAPEEIDSGIQAAAQAASDAATLAGNKGEVIYGSTTPVAAKQLPQNLWIDTTGNSNTPKRWNGSAWVVVTDKAATDAKAAADVAAAAAKTANDKAVVAQDAANQANNQVNAWKFTGTTEIDGGKIRADTITAAQLNVNELSAISGNLGTLITYKDPSQPLKARMVMQGSLITVYDDNNVMRVRMGLW